MLKKILWWCRKGTTEMFPAPEYYSPRAFRETRDIFSSAKPSSRPEIGDVFINKFIGGEWIIKRLVTAPVIELRNTASGELGQVEGYDTLPYAGFVPLTEILVEREEE